MHESQILSPVLQPQNTQLIAQNKGGVANDLLPWLVSGTEHSDFCIVGDTVIMGPRLLETGLSYACCPGVIMNNAFFYSEYLKLNDVG